MPSTHQLETTFPVFKAGSWLQTDSFSFFYPRLVKITFLFLSFQRREAQPSAPLMPPAWSRLHSKSPQGAQPSLGSVWPRHTASLYPPSTQPGSKAPVEIHTLKSLQEVTQSLLANTLCQRWKVVKVSVLTRCMLMTPSYMMQVSWNQNLSLKWIVSTSFFLSPFAHNSSSFNRIWTDRLILFTV